MKAKTKQAKYDRIHIIEANFAAELAGMIQNPPAGSVKMTVTPDMALDMLDYNTRNRPVKGGKVALYARQMEAGEWRYTGEPIIFSDAGRVIDGQHRLMACIEADTAIPVDVAFGRPDNAFAFIDVGAPRTAGDIFAINGVKNSSYCSSMTRMIWHYDQGRQTVSGGGGITSAELYDVFVSLGNVYDSLPVLHKFAASRLASPSLMGAMHHICSRKCKRDADAFFSLINEGGAGNGPAQELHRRLVKAAVANEKPTTDYLAGLVLTGWNRSRKSLSGRGLRFDGGKLPAVI